VFISQLASVPDGILSFVRSFVAWTVLALTFASDWQHYSLLLSPICCWAVRGEAAMAHSGCYCFNSEWWIGDLYGTRRWLSRW